MKEQRAQSESPAFANQPLGLFVFSVERPKKRPNMKQQKQQDNVQGVVGIVLIPISEVKKKLALKSDSSVYAFCRRRGFPLPLKGSKKFARWVLAEVDAYIQAMPRGADGVNPARKAA